MNVKFMVYGYNLPQRNIVPKNWKRGSIQSGQDYYEYWYTIAPYDMKIVDNMIKEYTDKEYRIEVQIY